MKSTVFLLSAFLAGILLSEKVFAEERRQEITSSDYSEWSVTAGAIGLYSPEYEGSDKYETSAWPLINIRYKNFFLDPGKGLGLYVLDRTDWRLGVSAGYRFGRDQDDSENLRGLGDVDGGITAGAFGEWRANNFFIDARFEHQLSGDSTGYLIDFGTGYFLMADRKVSVKLSIKATYASADYMGSFFSISREQSISSGLNVYDADADVKSIGPGLFILYMLDRHWGAQVIVAYDLLTGDAGESPVVKNENQFRAGLGLSYRF